MIVERRGVAAASRKLKLDTFNRQVMAAAAKEAVAMGAHSITFNPKNNGSVMVTVILDDGRRPENGSRGRSRSRSVDNIAGRRDRPSGGAKPKPGDAAADSEADVEAEGCEAETEGEAEAEAEATDARCHLKLQASHAALQERAVGIGLEREYREHHYSDYFKVAGAKGWYTPLDGEKRDTLVRVQQVVAADLQLKPITADNKLPSGMSKKNKGEAVRLGAVRLLNVDHERLLDEICRREELEYDEVEESSEDDSSEEEEEEGEEEEGEKEAGIVRAAHDKFFSAVAKKKLMTENR